MIVPAIIAAAVAVVLIPRLASWARSRNLLDVPNERSSHTEPTPRVGGVGIVAGVAAGLVAARLLGQPFLAHFAPLALGALALIAISVADDLRSLPALGRLTAQAAIAGTVVSMVYSAELVPFAAENRMLASALLTLWIVGLVNAYNFMDGIDGLAGGQAIAAAAGWAVAGAATGAPALTMAAVVIAAASAAFLRFNWAPARVFMGDAGSAFLGYAFAVLPLGIPPRHWSLAAAALFVWPFLFDTSFTLLRRLARGENVVQAHRSHLYQRLTSTGLRHSRVTGLYIALAGLGLPAGVFAAMGRPARAAACASVLPVAALALWYTVARREANAPRT